jgi:hypothetical protein
MGLLIFACARAEVDRAESEVRARTKAWGERFSDSSSAEAIDLPAASRVEWLTPGNPGRGLRRAEVSVPTPLLARLGLRGIEVRASHAILGGAWDSQEIHLGDRAPMAPHAQVSRFGQLAANPSDQLGRLGDFSTSHADQIARLKAGINAKVQEVGEKIPQLEQLVNSRRAAVEAAVNQANEVNAAISRATDPAEKEALERQEQELRRTVQLRQGDLSRAQAELRGANQVHSQIWQGTGR